MALGPMPMGVPGGGLPPGMGMPPGAPPQMAPPGNVGPATIPQHNPGNMKKAGELLNIALKAMNEAIPNIPLGTPVHGKILKMVTDLDKVIKEGAEAVQNTVQQMMQLMQAMKAKQQAQGQASMMAPPPPTQGPAMPPMGAPPPPSSEGM